MSKIFQGIQFGSLSLKNRIVLASMTRCRADPQTGNPQPPMAEYYAQRAESAGLILTECCFIDPHHNAYPGAGGLVTEEHAKGWKEVVDAVHEKGSAIITQIYHAGRTMHPDLNQGYPMGPSPLATPGNAYINGKPTPHVVPREMTHEDIAKTQDQFVHAAGVAKKAGFDGVELHAANGYLIDQFLRSSSNVRTDQYGGSVENRSRYLLETVEKLKAVYPAERIGVKISLVGRFQSDGDSDPVALGNYLLAELQKMGILYVQLAEAELQGDKSIPSGKDQIPNCASCFRKVFDGFIITNGFGTPQEAYRRIDAGEADLASFATLFIANPDLTERLKNGCELASSSREFYYTGGTKGYTDYPSYAL